MEKVVEGGKSRVRNADARSTASDYYDTAHAAKYFQLNLTLGLIDNMDDDGVELPAVPRAGADCSICLAHVADRAQWCQLEPCRCRRPGCRVRICAR